MNLPVLAAKNSMRNRFRTILTVLGVAVAIMAFLSLRTVLTAWEGASKFAAKDRLATRSKVSWVVTLPRDDVDKLKAKFPNDIKAISWANWFGAKDSLHPHEFFASLAVDPKSTLDVYEELSVPEDQKQAWFADKTGAVVGAPLAKKMGWQIGQKVTLTGGVYPGDWTFTIRGFYTVTKQGMDKGQFFFNWAYVNDKLPAEYKEKIGWMVIRLDGATKGAEFGKAIDEFFKPTGFPTLTQSETELRRSFLSVFAAILRAINIVSIVILAIMMLILGNTISMGVRERTNEYGVLRAIGFLPKHVVMFIVGEALTVGLIGGAVGLGLGYPLVNMGMGKWLEENVSNFFPEFGIAPQTAIMAMILAVALAAVASAVPAIRASRLVVTDALRRVG